MLYNNLLLSNTKLNKAVGGALFNENNNNSFLQLENVYSTTILDKLKEKEKKDNSTIIGFGLAHLQSPNQIKDFKELLPDLTTLPQYFTAFAEPLARPLLQCIVEQLAKQSFGNTFDMEVTKNMSVDLYDSESGIDEYSNKLWRDSAGFIVTDRFRYFEIKIKKELLLSTINENNSSYLINYSILPLNSQTKTLFSIYDQNICSFGRNDYLEFLFSLNGANGMVALNNEDNQPLGYILALNDGRILQCYAENGEIARSLLHSLIIANKDILIYSMFIRISSEEENKLNIKLMEKAENANNCLLGDIPSIVKINEYGHPELFCKPPICDIFSNFERNNENNKLKCNNKFLNTFCNKTNEWIGEIKKEEKENNNLNLKCCLIPNLSQWAAPLKKVVIKKGEKFEGGPVLQKGEIIAFDFVKEIQKNVSEENKHPDNNKLNKEKEEKENNLNNKTIKEEYLNEKRRKQQKQSIYLRKPLLSYYLRRLARINNLKK
uniref:DUF7596 domain-containing protein n=1 Tax=Meloidogyne hapla TaxID=6305 RepID=A0A1I8AYM9_MELHA